MTKKILMVDDQPFILTIGREILERGGFSVITANDGLEGVTVAKTHRPDLIIMDVEMPNMNGFEACRRLRQDETLKQTPIIMLTSKTEANYMEEGFRAGATLYIGKPINEEKLITVIKAVIGKTC